MDKAFTVDVGGARPHMFACRLSSVEYEALESLLKLSSCEGFSKSDAFRSILLELKGRLYRNFVDYLKYRSPKYEANLKDL